jgi:RimJ/RimL family protein N-acetyltransferase
MEPDMLQDLPTPTLREARGCVLETERLTLRRPTLADVKAIACLANDRRIAENTRRLPHP